MLAKRIGPSENGGLTTFSQALKSCLLPLAACASLACGAESKPAQAPKAGAGVRWVGRVDLANGAPRFAWSGSGLTAKVSGTTLSVKLSSQGTSDDVYFQPVIDGAPVARVKLPPGEHTVLLASGLAPGEHTLSLYRETEGSHGISAFAGFVEGTPEPAPPPSDRLLEIIGDSISAGYGNLGSEQHPNFGPDPGGGCRFSTETESAYLSYGAIAARTLGAEASIVALSGWGAYRDYGSSTSNVLAKVYENTLGTTPAPAWGFERKAQVVVLNLGTNDFAHGDPGQNEFRSAYSALLGTVRSKYPEAWIFCMIGPMLYGDGLSAATASITAIVAGAKSSGDAKVRLFDVGQQDASRGTGCDWHPNAATHGVLAARLATEIRAAVGW